MDHFLLRNGEELVIRSIRPDDDDSLRAAYERLSPESKYRRFLALKPSLSLKDTRHLVDVDGRDHVALVAVSPTEGIVGVARFVRLREDPAGAEFAIVVGDELQGSGLGRALLTILAARARERGVERFVGSMLAENLAAHRLVERVAAAPPRLRHFGAVDEVEFDLAAVPSLLAA